MGIDNLLNFLKPALVERCITYYRGKTAAIDAMSWLYRGCYSCAHELNQDIKTNDYLYYVQKMLVMLREYEITPILVFDGRNLRAKEKTEQMRKQIKQQNLLKAKELSESGNQEEAKKYFQRCLKIRKQMMYTTFDVLKELEVQYIIAPYEADSQIAHMCLSGQCDFAITEDSDLICYQCPLIVFKLQNNGACFELELQKLRESRQNRAHIKSDDIRQFLAFKNEQLIDVCIMSGCDYVPSIRGMGIRKAIDFMSKYNDISNVISKLKKVKQFIGKIPEEYEKIVKATRLIFQFQTVYCTIKKQWIQLNQEKYEDFISKLEQDQFLPLNQIEQLVGEKIQENLQVQFCNGDLDIKTLIFRERMKIDFNQLFKRIERRLENSKQQIVDIEAKQRVQQFLQTADIDNLPEFVEKPANVIREQQFLAPKRTQIQKEELNIFQLCEEIFDQQEKNNQQNVDELEIVQGEDDNEELFKTKQKQVQIIQKNDDEEINSNESSSEFFNPFQNKSKIINTQCLSQIKSKPTQDQSTQKKQSIKSIEKALKQTQSTIFSFVKK
ncbi:unnamed protein product [Paramecium pentaurelia]|uniref:Exonuclease 1 n=1 Tax=Paramecium pentaurelia TaxID=43138 RepID=A0A8S1Y3B7_9CILI|nr:unnamed protein product [Paramecium pentaurelia]